MRINYELEVEEVNLILKALNKLPREESNALCLKLEVEGNKQLNPEPDVSSEEAED